MRIRLIAILVFCVVVWTPVWTESSPAKVCLVVSREIRPFLVMADELQASLKFPVTRVYLDATYRPYGEDGKLLEIVEKDFRLFIAIGPRALTYLLENNIKTQIIYGMVLNPESFIRDSDRHVTGVSLNIFSLTQLSHIKKIFPEIKKIGVLYDPEHNQNWFSAAMLLANSQQIELVSLSVSDRSQIPAVLNERTKKVDAVLFIPDATVISTTIIRHAIKQLILKRIPTIGYNSFFVEAGSAMSFVMDYEKMGRQVANLAHAHLNEDTRIPVEPLFNVTLNIRVIQLLDLQLNDPLPENVTFIE